MKKLKVFLGIMVMFLGITTSISAQSNFTPAENEGWIVSLDEAYELSQETGKPILANFTGSDWCGWCKRLTAEVFTKEEFKTWAKDNVILLELDFPRRKQLAQEQMNQNRSLQQAFSVTGYPTLWLFNIYEDTESNQKYKLEALGKTGYVRGGAQPFITAVQQYM